jgi:hypothetical protein
MLSGLELILVPTVAGRGGGVEQQPPLVQEGKTRKSQRFFMDLTPMVLLCFIVFQ